MEGAGGEKLSRRRRMGVFSFGGIGAFFFSFLEKCVLPFHFAQSSVLAISNSRHDNVRASSTLFIWLNENVGFVNQCVGFVNQCVGFVNRCVGFVKQSFYCSLIGLSSFGSKPCKCRRRYAETG